MIKIILTGPESSGKTSLAKAISTLYDVPWVSEYARQYLTEKDGIYEYEDLLKIAKGQIEAENRFAKFKPEFLICDTSLLVIIIWSAHKFKKVDVWIESELDKLKDCHWLLCKPDFPWEYDAFRESEHEREILYNLYLRTLKQKAFNFIELGGPLDGRIKAVDAYFKSIV